MQKNAKAKSTRFADSIYTKQVTVRSRQFSGLRTDWVSNTSVQKLGQDEAISLAWGSFFNLWQMRLKKFVKQPETLDTVSAVHS